MSRVFLLEDDLALGKALQQSLRAAGFAADWRRRAADARDALEEATYAAAILDVELPDGSGIDVVERMRARDDHTPVLFLTVHDAVEERVRGLDAGADDYLSKPFAVAELVSRLHALIRRSAGQAAPAWKIGALLIEPGRCRVVLDGQTLELPLQEYRLLFELARQAGQVVSRERLEAAVFRASERIGSNLLDVHIHHLRRKIGTELIRTVRGVGYVLDA